MEEIKNGTQVNNNDGTVEATQPVQNNVPQQAPVQQIVVTAAPPKENFFKKHWKKFAAGGAAVLTAVGSAFVAYNKGKQVGAQQYYPPQDGEDYSLDPNVN